MNFFYVFHMKNFKNVLILMVIAFVTASLLYMQSTLSIPIFSTDQSQSPRAIYQGEEKSNNVSLTFNISWGDENALPILDTLEENQIKTATFFLSASWAERHPEIVQRIKEDGHEIGSMGYEYENYNKLTIEEIKKDLSLSKDVFDKLQIKNIELFRPPKGDFNKSVLQAADSFGYTTIHYSVNSQDIRNPGVNGIVESVTKPLKGGDIILLNASDDAKQTNDALPQIISLTKQKGLSFVTVSKLISNSEARSKEVNTSY
ncbi:polysaccharide deacetylase family sporulation protein PdaB [Bacillus carboniphilus]|uniref:Polysaccharide deacetylase family sporulation protein PdaB n=1 Tax=Bacillus carboniphilus TaxID=86663 RepID=A0ABY9JRJ7_9BACI|nr:polysaccharide deacetylase family sporulation protein PdaB [Bacillus carboniphilus]WLR42024.1 polysaccharide deacetylase family sporulation protein PdaB [Bacillus carboniphilus]